MPEAENVGQEMGCPETRVSGRGVQGTPSVGATDTSKPGTPTGGPPQDARPAAGATTEEEFSGMAGGRGGKDAHRD